MQDNADWLVMPAKPQRLVGHNSGRHLYADGISI